jgi:hypothetical protein
MKIQKKKQIPKLKIEEVKTVSDSPKPIDQKPVEPEVLKTEEKLKISTMNRARKDQVQEPKREAAFLTRRLTGKDGKNPESFLNVSFPMFVKLVAFATKNALIIYTDWN